MLSDAIHIASYPQLFTPHLSKSTSRKRPQLFQVATAILGRAFSSHSRRQREIARQSPPCAKPNDFPAHSCLEDLLPWPPRPRVALTACQAMRATLPQ